MKVFKIFGIIVFLILTGIISFLYKNLHNRHPGYQVDIEVKNNSKVTLKVGFSAIPVTPEIKIRMHNLTRKMGIPIQMAMETESSMLYGWPDSRINDPQTVFMMISGPGPW
jgi:hypothetical protein